MKEFFSKSKKMFNPPKDLPSISPPKPLPTMAGLNSQVLQETGNLTIRNESPVAEGKRTLTLPTIEPPRTQEIIISPPKPRELPAITLPDEPASFDDAIRNIHQDIMKKSNDEEKRPFAAEQQSSNDEYYDPKEAGEGYFSEIKQYLGSKDINSILDDLISKDMLTGMKDYHDYKSQGKPFYLHSKDLQHKLERKMHLLVSKEQQWHDVKKALDDKERKKRLLEKEIDEEAQDLKELFTLIRISQVLGKEAPAGQEFLLITGQKLRSLNDLRKALSYLKDEEYSHHANSQKNDFASWTEHALGLAELAARMRQSPGKADLELLLKKPL